MLRCSCNRWVLRLVLTVWILIILPLSAWAAGASDGPSPYAYHLNELFGLPITNSIVTSWFFSLLIILVCRLAVGKPQLIPARGQAVVEHLLEGIRGIIAPIVGKRVATVTFPLLIGLFTFILIHNWSGLLPGVGTFGLWEGEGEDRHLTYFFRPANADLNMTLALAFSAFGAWLYYTLRYAGPKAILADLFGNKADKRELPSGIFYLLFLVFFAVGLVEMISIVFRPISLSLRLFGNVFGGESLLASMTGLVSWIVPVPFYFLESLIGLVQALVFTILTAVYIGLICNHSDGDRGH